jgi:broad specificity phosphatase PhoE
MTRLYLVRHGAVDSGQTFYGHLDVPLSEAGHQQAKELADRLASLEIAAVFSSDLQRAMDCARPIAFRHGLEAVPDPAFREMNLGVLEGLPYIEAREKFPELATKRYKDMWSYRFPGGENLEDIAARARPRLNSLLERFAQKTVVLVAHNSVNRVLIGDALGLTLDNVFDFAQDFGCINWIDFGKRPRVGLINWTPGAPV